MKTLLGIVVVLAFGAMTAACRGGDGRLSREQYFTRMQATVDDAARRFSELGDDRARASNGTLDFSARKGASRTFLGRYAEIVADTHNRLASIRPPSDLTLAHDHLVEAQAAFQSLVDKAKTAAAGAESGAQLEDAFTAFGADFSVTQGGFRLACNALQKLAVESSITVDLRC